MTIELILEVLTFEWYTALRKQPTPVLSFRSICFEVLIETYFLLFNRICFMIDL